MKNISRLLLISYLIISIVLASIACSFNEAGTVTPVSVSVNTTTHGSTHENSGSDEIDVTGLSGLLADNQSPLADNVIDIIEATPGIIMRAFSMGGTVTTQGYDFNQAGNDIEFYGTNSLSNFVIRANTGNDGVELELYHGNPSCENEVIGRIMWHGRDANNNETWYGFFQIYPLDSTNGNETGQWEWWTLDKGFNNLSMTLSANGTLGLDIGYETFDKYDDAELLRRGIRDKEYNLLVDANILRPQYNTYELDDNNEPVRTPVERLEQTGFMVNVQNYLNLLAGGIYQNRDKIDTLIQENIELKQRIEALERSN